MGGTVAVTLRKPDGTEYRMNRWTNSMPWGIMNMKMLTHDMAHVDEYLEQWLGMKADYEKNKGTGKFEHNMTDCYFPSEGLAPCGYGLVVVDMVNNVILDMQGYTSFESMCAASIGMEHGNTYGTQASDEDSNTSIFKAFLDAGKVTGMLTRDSFDKDLPRDEWYKPVTQSFEELLAEITGDKRDIFDFKLDLAPFTYEKFEECEPQALRDYRARLLELGFTLTDEENKIWADTIKEYEEEEGFEEYEDA